MRVTVKGFLGWGLGVERSVRKENGTEKQDTRKPNSLAVAFRLDPSDAGDDKILSCSFRW